MRYVLGILVILLLGGGAWIAVRPSLPATVEVVQPVRGTAVQAVYATGTVEATVMMPIAPRAAARLMQLNADEGSDVKQGEILGQLEDTDLQNRLDGLRAREKFAANDYERKKTLLAKGFQTQASVDQAKAEWDAARASIAEAEAAASYMRLVAPADGRIIRRDGEIGQLIPANQAVFWLSCCAPLRISAEVDEEDIAMVRPGQNVLIRADAYPGKVFNGTVQSITPRGDPVARSYRVRITFNEETPLYIGMTAETNIITGENKDALLVPSSAVRQNKIWVVQGDVLKHVPVVTGAKGPEQTEIREGLAETDQVVAKPEATLQEGKKVRALDYKPAPVPQAK